MKKLSDFIRRNKLTLPLIMFAILLTAIIIFYAKYSNELYDVLRDKDSMRAWLISFDGYGKVVFVCIRALQTVVKFIPAEPLEIGAGYVFGTFQGCLLCLLGTEIGSFAILLLTKFMGTRIINAIIPEKQINVAQKYIARVNVKMSLLIIYLIPGTPKDLITYFIFMLPVTVPQFFIITAFARIPSIITSTWCGSALGESNYFLSASIFILTLVAGIVSGVIYARYTKIKDKRDSENSKKTA